MICNLERQIFPKDNQESANGFYILKYVCNEHLSDCEMAYDEKGEDLYQQIFFAKGYYLPRTTSCQYDLKGHWETNKKMGGKTFVIESYEQIVKKDRASITGFLMDCFCGKGIGVGHQIVLKLYDHFGEDILEIFDKDPERLKEVKGISQEKYEGMLALYNSQLGARDVLMTLEPLGISHKVAVKIYETLKDSAVDIINNHPYQLCQFKGISFNIADIIAVKNHLDLCSEERAAAGIVEVLKEAEYGGDQFRIATGHLCVEYNELMNKTFNLLKRQVPINVIQNAYKDLYQRKAIVVSFDPYDKTKKVYVYRKQVAEVETSLAQSIARLALFKVNEHFDLDEEIRLMELEEKVSLAPEQRNAVKLGLSNSFGVITGGPGTGKTTIIKFIRNIYIKNHPEKKILMCSPTGVAATRMSESTNGEACTVHKALNLVANEDGFYNDVDFLDYDLIIVDETSMLDVYLAKVLCNAIKNGARILFIGDIDQLPSVGPGAVLRDIIESRVIPVAVLTKVYRQADGSLIALNSLLIKNGKCSFDYGEAFQFIPVNNFEEASTIMKSLYLKEIAVNGIQNVMMLSPFRQKTESGVNQLNLIRDEVNPPSKEKREITYMNRNYREGDKVIQLKNIDNISNGDVGFITKIYKETTDKGTVVQKVKIDFGHGRIVSYLLDDLEMIDWAYAITVHKSQGSEANTVIVDLLDGHGIMLKRDLLYTAVTRAKKKVYIVGTMSAIEKAVSSGMSKEERRATLLSAKIRYFMEQGAA